LVKGAVKSEVLDKLRAVINSSRPQCAIESKSPVVGYLCSYTPPEILMAAGIYPIRLRGAGVEDSSSGDTYLSHLNCSFARHVTAAVLDGLYDYLAGQISVNTCDHIRRANDAIVAKSDLGYHGYISVPRSFRGSLFPWYVEELNALKSSLEAHFGVKITEDALNVAIEKTNQVRDRIERLDALRRRDPPKINGADVLTSSVAARIMPPEKFVELADELIAASEEAEPIADIRARVILIGGELDDPRFVHTIEGQGAHVAGDMLCYGTRGLGRKVEPGADPIKSLARAYLYQIPCARMMGEFPERYQTMLDLYRGVKARGIIFQRIKFCQIWSSEVHNLRHRFESEPLPMLVLDREYGLVHSGQIKTRVQAFLESLGA